MAGKKLMASTRHAMVAGEDGKGRVAACDGKPIGEPWDRESVTCNACIELMEEEERDKLCEVEDCISGFIFQKGSIHVCADLIYPMVRKLVEKALADIDAERPRDVWENKGGMWTLNGIPELTAPQDVREQFQRQCGEDPSPVVVFRTTRLVNEG